MKLLLLLLMAAGAVASFLVAPIDTFQNPDLARIVFWHLPCALTCAGFFVAGPYYGWRYLKTGERKWDVRAEASLEMAFLLGVLTLLTGMLFSKTQWGAWWNWDPRQTSFLMVQLFLGAYFAVRSAFADEARRAANSAAYLLATLLPTLFLIFVFPRLPAVKSLHPNVVQDGSLSPDYKYTFYAMLVLISLVCGWLVKLRIRGGLLELQLDQRNAELADRDRSAAPGVVRPVPVRPPGGEAAEGP